MEGSADTKEISWNSSLEKMFAEEGEKSFGLSIIHRHCEAYYGIRNHWISIPVIILSTLAGSASVGSTSLFDDPKLASIAIGGVSICVGILQTLGSFFSFAKRSEAHRIASISYGKLYRFISVELTLPRSERIIAKDMLKIVRQDIERLAETTPLPPDTILTKFNILGKKYSDIMLPDIVNGLRKVIINTSSSMFSPRSHIRSIHNNSPDSSFELKIPEDVIVKPLELAKNVIMTPVVTSSEIEKNLNIVSEKLTEYVKEEKLESIDEE